MERTSSFGSKEEARKEVEAHLSRRRPSKAGFPSIWFRNRTINSPETLALSLPDLHLRDRLRKIKKQPEESEAREFQPLLPLLQLLPPPPSPSLFSLRMSNPATLKLLTLLNVSAIHSTNKRRQSLPSTPASTEPKVIKRKKSVVFPDELESGPSGSGSTHSTPSRKKVKIVEQVVVAEGPKVGAGGGKKAGKKGKKEVEVAQEEQDSEEETAAGGE